MADAGNNEGLTTALERDEGKAIDGYVPTIMCPEGEGYGDYVIMEIAADGTIANWKVDLSEFEEPPQ